MTRSILDSSLPSLGEASRLAAMGRGIRVLVAEDERDTLMTLGILLRSEDFEVHMVAEGSKVAEAVRDFKPHVVVLDIGMPGRNGYDVASDLRREHGERCPTLIALTAYTTAAEIARAHGSGFHHHIGKPYDPVRLIELLAAVKS
jgi:CheY-like chemotaxis protein